MDMGLIEMEPKALLMNGHGLLLMNGHGLDGDGAQSSFNEWTWAHRLGLMMGMEPKALSKSY